MEATDKIVVVQPQTSWAKHAVGVGLVVATLAGALWVSGSLEIVDVTPGQVAPTAAVSQPPARPIATPATNAGSGINTGTQPRTEPVVSQPQPIEGVFVPAQGKSGSAIGGAKQAEPEHIGVGKQAEPETGAAQGQSFVPTTVPQGKSGARPGGIGAIGGGARP